MELRAGARWGALTAGLVLGCWRGPALAPEPPLAVIPFDPYGGAIYVPGVINGDSAWLMLDTGLSRTGLDRDWAATIHAVPVATAGQVAETASAVVATIRLGDLELPDHQVALYPLRGLSEASGRLQQGLLGHDVLQRFTIETPIGTGLAGELRGTIARVQELRLGAVKVPSPTTGLGGERKGFLARTDIDGVIGNAAFEGSRLIVDYARRRVIIEAGAAPRSRCDYDTSGLRLVARGPGLSRLVVDYVVPGSPSADAGIRAGDEVLLIDGRAVAGANLSDVRTVLRVDGVVRRLVLRRASDTMRVALKLRRLL